MRVFGHQGNKVFGYEVLGQQGARVAGYAGIRVLELFRHGAVWVLEYTTY